MIVSELIKMLKLMPKNATVSVRDVGFTESDSPHIDIDIEGASCFLKDERNRDSACVVLVVNSDN